MNYRYWLTLLSSTLNINWGNVNNELIILTTKIPRIFENQRKVTINEEISTVRYNSYTTEQRNIILVNKNILKIIVNETNMYWLLLHASLVTVILPITECFIDCFMLWHILIIDSLLSMNNILLCEYNKFCLPIHHQLTNIWV